MNKYNTFLALFIVSVIAMIAVFVFYLQGIYSFVSTMRELEGNEPDPFYMFKTIFTPRLIVAAVVAALSGLTYRILGIVYVAKNKIAGDGEKALWIVGFVLMGFITGIVFLVMAKGRKFVD